MNKYQTKGIILRRVDYGEADRIITFLSNTHGKVASMAKGVKRPKSKLSGGLELFSLSNLTFLEGKKNLEQLISARLIKHYRNILHDYERVQVGYKAIELVDKLTENDVGEEFFDLLHATFEELEDLHNPRVLVEIWFRLNLLDMLGHLPNLTHDDSNTKLAEEGEYTFVPSDGMFVKKPGGVFGSNQIKAWRVLLRNKPTQARKIQKLDEALEPTLEPLKAFYRELFHQD